MKNQNSRLAILLGTTLTLVAAAAIFHPDLGAGVIQVSEQQETSCRYDRQTLEKYAAVSRKQVKIQDELIRQIRDIASEEQAARISLKADREKIGAIRQQGLDLRTYNEITYQLNVDMELKKKIEQISRHLGG